MKINYALIARCLIALLFVVAGVGKLMTFTKTAADLAAIGVPLATLVTIIVIIIEIPVALLFAYGYRVCATGMTLIGFTLLTTLVVHRDITAGMNLIMALKNLAIMGGILAVITGCDCGKCPAIMKGKKGE